MGQYQRWCFTLNNPSPTRDYVADIFSDPEFFVKRAVYGEEIAPTTGTRHLQGYVEYDRSRRLTHCKKLFPGAHWEAAKGNARSNYDYCIKDDKYKTYGEWESVLKTKPGAEKRKAVSSIDVMRGLLSDDPESVKNTGCYLSRKKTFDERVMEVRELRERHRRYERFSKCMLSKWQFEMCGRLFNQNERQITWVADTNGGVGKSWLAHYLASVYQADLFDGVTACKDVAWQLSPNPELIIFDVTRSDQSHFSYQTLESCKNGFVMSGKYTGIKRYFPPPKVIVFANFEPDRSRLSEDRWDIHNISNNGWTQVDKTPLFSPEALRPFKRPRPLPDLEEEEELPPQKKQLSDANSSGELRCQPPKESDLPPPALACALRGDRVQEEDTVIPVDAN